MSSGQPEEFETIVVGGGQAGLAVGYHLARHRRRFVILDAADRIGDAWRQRWDGLRLFTPARYDGLPGMAFPAPPGSLPTKDDVAGYLEGYARRFGLPVRSGIRVTEVRAAEPGDRFQVAAGEQLFRAANVVIATGAYRQPQIPDFAADLDPTIHQVHSVDYRNASGLRPGRVLVVGASNSGAEIALDASGRHEVILSGPDKGKMPVRPESRMARLFDIPFWFFINHVATLGTPIGRRALPIVRDHGGPLERVWPEDLAAAGVERIHERMVGVRDGLPVLEGGRVVEVTNVVWATGFRPAFDWLPAPAIGADGWPIQRRGVASGMPGLYFVGLPFLHSAASALLGGVGRDAAHVVDHLARARQAAAVSRSAATFEAGPDPVRMRTPSPPPVSTDRAS